MKTFTYGAACALVATATLAKTTTILGSLWCAALILLGCWSVAKALDLH